MDAPEELRQVLASVMRRTYFTEHAKAEAEDLIAADAVLAVPAIADALAAARTCEQDMARLVEERDEAQEWADRLAACAGGPDVIGEHSNVNNPWANALDLLRGDAQ